jgi:hypothetical protein
MILSRSGRRTFTPTGARAMAFDEIKGRFTRVRVGRVVRLLRYL